MVQTLIDYGRYIYHFTNYDKAFFYILPKLKLRLSSYLESNDPKESKTFGFWSILQDCDDSNIHNIKTEFERYLKNGCKQLCFSMDYIIKNRKTSYMTAGYKNPIMWAHYANRSKGVCLVIDKELFDDQNMNLIKRRVKYKSMLNFPRIEMNKWENKKDLYFKRFLKQNANELFFQKYLQWSSEHEIKYIGIESQEFCTIEDSLFGVYLGPDFNEELIEVALKVIPDSKRIAKVIITDGRFNSFPVR